MVASSSRTRLVVAEGNLRGYRGLTLDAFGALLEDGPMHVPAGLRRVVQDRGLGPDEPAVDDLWTRSLLKHVRTEPFLAFREVHRATFREIFASLGIKASADDYVDEALDAYRKVRAFPEVAAVLQELEREVPLAVISNMDTKLLLEALHANGLDFAFVITSEEEQRYKPDVSLFRRAIRYLGLPAAHLLHVGDSYADDVVGASSAGMGAALMQRSARPKGPPIEDSRVVHDLREVRDLIRSSWVTHA